jgi:hypothetical protein
VKAHLRASPLRFNLLAGSSPSANVSFSFERKKNTALHRLSQTSHSQHWPVIFGKPESSAIFRVAHIQEQSDVIQIYSSPENHPGMNSARVFRRNKASRFRECARCVLHRKSKEIQTCIGPRSEMQLLVLQTQLIHRVSMFNWAVNVLTVIRPAFAAIEQAC